MKNKWIFPLSNHLLCVSLHYRNTITNINTNNYERNEFR